jgi:hypothetical protein
VQFPMGLLLGVQLLSCGVPVRLPASGGRRAAFIVEFRLAISRAGSQFPDAAGERASPRSSGT